jgi:hypothetical protein
LKREHLPAIALWLSVPLLGALVYGGATTPDGGTPLPLLALLFIAEFGAIVNLGGAAVGAAGLRRKPRSSRALARLGANLLLAAAFVVQLVRFWPL